MQWHDSAWIPVQIKTHDDHLPVSAATLVLHDISLPVDPLSVQQKIPHWIGVRDSLQETSKPI